LVVGEDLVVVAAAGRAAAAAQGDPQVVFGAGVGDGVLAAAAVVEVALAGRYRVNEQVVAGTAEQVVAARVGVEDVAAAVALEPVVAVVGAVVVLARFEDVVAVAADERVVVGIAVDSHPGAGRDARVDDDRVVAVAAGDDDQRRAAGVGADHRAAVRGRGLAAVAGEDRHRRGDDPGVVAAGDTDVVVLGAALDDQAGAVEPLVEDPVGEARGRRLFGAARGLDVEAVAGVGAGA